MKNLMIGFILLTMSAQTFAGINHRKYKKEADMILKLEEQGQYQLAALRSSYIAQDIAKAGKFDEIVASVTTTLTEKKKETVTDKYSASAGLRLLFISASGSLKFDAVKILTTNPEDVARFSEVKERDFNKVQKKLDKHLQKYETEFYYSKAFATKSLQLASKASIDEVNEIKDVLLETVYNVSSMNFLGVQNIMNCTEMKYANRSQSAGFNVSAFLFSINAGAKHSQKGHKETACTATSEEISISESKLSSLELFEIDEALDNEAKLFSLKVVKETKAEEYPTWGLPYMN